MGRFRKRHSAAFKAIAELAQQHQIHPVQISQWKKQLLDGLEGLFENGAASGIGEWTFPWDDEELGSNLGDLASRRRAAAVPAPYIGFR